MKKFIIIFSTFLFLFFSINTIITSAQPPSKTLSQGVYSVKDNLIAGVSYNIQNTSSSNKAVVIVLDPNKALQEFISLEPKEVHNNLKPLHFGDTIVIVGNTDIAFS
jgi:hypothetical protein